MTERVYFVNKAWVSSFVRPQVLSTYDVSHVINFTRLSPFLFVFRTCAGRAWEQGYVHCGSNEPQKFNTWKF